MSQRLLITADASGIGREIARAFVANGAKVFVCDIDSKALEALATELGGLIIKMFSIAGRFGYANRSPYSTTNWGLIGFTKTSAIELGGFNIRANAMLPGALEGPRIDRVLEGRAKASGRSVDEERVCAVHPILETIC